MSFYIKYFIILQISIFSFVVQSKTEYWECDGFSFKMVMPLIGFNKIYSKKKDKWTKINKFEITDKDFILFNLSPNQKKCINEQCKVNFSISRTFFSKNFSNYKSIVNNDYCKIDGSDKCFIRKKGKNLQKGYCKKYIK